MAKQFHFVVMYDEETGKFEMDYDTQDVKFDNCPIYDVDADEWENCLGHLDDDNSTYNRAADTIYLAIKDLPLRDVE